MFKITLKLPDESGALRYMNPDKVVVISPDPAGGSIIFEDDDTQYMCEETADVLVTRWYAAQALKHGVADEPVACTAIACGKEVAETADRLLRELT